MNTKRVMTKEEFKERVLKDQHTRKLIQREEIYKAKSEYMNNSADVFRREGKYDNFYNKVLQNYKKGKGE